MRLLGAFLVVVCATSVSVQAAEITRVASSLEDNDPFGMYMDFTFDRLQDKGKLVREWYQNGTNQDVTELRYQLVQTALDLDLHLGIFRDLELHVGAPIIFAQDRTWGFASGTDASRTTIYRNCIDARGNLCSTPGFGDGRLFEVGDGVASYRAGLGNVSFGLGWAALNQKKQWTDPTWVLRFDYTAPTAPVLDPTITTSSASRGAIGDKLHRYTWSTSISKKLKFVEPYFELWYTLPWRGPAFYSNCDNPNDVNMARAENCGIPGSPWTRDETGIRPPHTGGFVFGTELTIFERPERFQRVVLDLRGWGTYVSEGRYYNEMSDLFQKLLYTSDYGIIGGHVGFIGQAADFVTLKVYGQFQYLTEHYMTNENIGKDWKNNNGTVDVSLFPEEINPNFDYRVDKAGRRFRMQEQWTFRLLVTAYFNF